MKNRFNTYFAFLFIPFIFSSCATIVGGARYNARIIVADNPDAKIYYDGQYIGTGTSNIKVRRKDANKFEFTVKQDGCPDKNFNYNSRTFRGWALLGSIITFTGNIGPIPFPSGVIVDIINGAYWKPNVYERGITKDDYKNYRYVVNAKCSGNNSDQSQNKLPQMIDVVYLKNGSIVKGMIIEQVPGVSIKIKTRDDSLFIFKIEEVERITKEESK